MKNVYIMADNFMRLAQGLQSTQNKLAEKNNNSEVQRLLNEIEDYLISINVKDPTINNIISKLFDMTFQYEREPCLDTLELLIAAMEKGSLKIKDIAYREQWHRGTYNLLTPVYLVISKRLGVFSLKLNAIQYGVKLAQDFELDGPNIKIEPMEGLVQKAVELLKQKDSNYFKGVRSIVLNTAGGAFGNVESGPDKDPAVINLNFSRIKQDVLSKGGSEDDVVRAVAEIIAHEKGHVASFKPEQGFVGGESPAEQEAQRIRGILNH